MARAISRSRNSQARSPRRVTLAPMGMPSRSLKAAMDWRARVTTGFWPVITSRSRDRPFDERGLLGGLAHAHVDHDLLEARDLHDVGQSQLLSGARPAVVVS